MLCQFLLYSKVNQLYVYIYSLLFGFPSHLDHHRALSRVLCAIQQVLISYLVYTQQCIYVNPNLPIYPSPASHLVTINLFSTPMTISVGVLFTSLLEYICFTMLLVSAVQQSESVICIHISPYPFPLKPPSHPPYSTPLHSHKALS